MADCSTAMWGFFLARLQHCTIGGSPARVRSSTSIFTNPSCACLVTPSHYDATGVARQRNGSVWYINPLSVTAQASDGYVTVIPPFGRSPIDGTPVRLEKEEARCREWLAQWIGARTVSEAVEEARANGWSATKDNSVQDILSDQHVGARQNVINVTHPPLGAFRMQASLPRLARANGYVRESWPELGEDNKSV